MDDANERLKVSSTHVQFDVNVVIHCLIKSAFQNCGGTSALFAKMRLPVASYSRPRMQSVLKNAISIDESGWPKVKSLGCYYVVRIIDRWRRVVSSTVRVPTSALVSRMKDLRQ